MDRPEILELLRADGAKIYAEVVSGKDTKTVPKGVKLIPVSGFMVWGAPGVMEGLTALLEQGDFRLPIDVKIVGKGLDSMGEALEEMRKGVSGIKLVVSL